MNVVYIKHFENGKKYVGITSNFKKRMNQHKNPKPKEQHLPIYKAMNKHDHYTEIVFESELYKDVQEMERIIIRNFKDLGIGLYNLTDGGEGVSREIDWDSTTNRPKEYYVFNPVLKSSFKTSCEIQGWNIYDFEEVFSGEYYHFKDINRKIKKYFYIYKGGRDDK